MGCDSPEVNVGKIYGRPMPKEKEENVRIDTIRSCVVKDKDRFILTRAYELKLGKETMRFHAPYDPDATFLAYGLTGAKVRYSYVTRARGSDGEYSVNEMHRFEILEGPLTGNAYEFDSWKVDRKELSKSVRDAQQRYEVNALEGKVVSCIVQENILHTRIGRRDVDIAIPREWRVNQRLPRSELLAYAMLNHRVRYETYKQRDPVELARHEYYREKMSPEQHHRLALLSGELRGYEFEWQL